MATDPLFGTTAVSVTTTAVSTSSTASIAGECVVVTVGNIAATAQFAANASVRVRNTTSAITTGWQSTGLLFVGQIATLYHNLPVATGDTVVVDIIAPATITASKTTIAAVLTTTASSVLLREDGRGLPLGCQSGGTQYAAGAAQVVIAAPPAGFRLLLSSALISALAYVSGNTNATVNATVNGASALLLTTTGSTGTVLASPTLTNAPWPAGVLCDPATSVTVTVGSGTTAVQLPFVGVAYDVVPL